jgi:hypothetical protein
MFAVTERVGGLASAGERLIVLYEYEVVVHDRVGDVERRILAAPGFHFADVDTVPASEGRPEAVVLAAHALDGRRITRISVHPL